MLLIETPRVGSGHDNNRPFVPHLSVLDREGEQLAAQAGSSGLWPDKQQGDLAWAEAKEAKNPGAPLGKDELTGLDGRMVNFVGSVFEPGVKLRWRVRRLAEIEH